MVLWGQKKYVVTYWPVLLQCFRKPELTSFIYHSFLQVELQRSSSSDTEDTIFNYRRKYLPTRQVVYHTPPRFPAEVIDCIRKGISLLFRRLGLHDFARIDGWFLPSPVSSLPSAENSEKIGNTKYGTVLFTDINLVSIFIPLFVLKFG